MNKKLSRVYDIIIRYIIIIFFGLPNLWVFYFIFTPLTVYPVYFLFNIFFDASLSGNTITISGNFIEIVKACVAGSAYYLLLILNLSTPKIKLMRRIKIIGLAFISLLIINILRILLLGLFSFSSPIWFDIIHKLFWYLLSIVFVIGIWFAEVKLFKIKDIPFYSDLKFLFKHSYLKR